MSDALTVVLHGHLAEKFGARFELYVETAGEALRALHANFPGTFFNALSDGSYYLIRGDEEEGMGLEEDHLNEFRLGKTELHLIPVIEGSAGRGQGKGGGIKAILGIALIGVALFASGGLAGGGLAALGTTAFSIGGMSISWGSIALFGLAMAVTGAASMLSQKEKPKEETKRDDSFSFAGPINVNEQGNPVPLIYGRVMTGGIPISSGIDIEDIGTFAGQSGSGVPGRDQVLVDGVWFPVNNPHDNVPNSVE